jgi:hypothetical protein
MFVLLLIVVKSLKIIMLQRFLPSNFANPFLRLQFFSHRASTLVVEALSQHLALQYRLESLLLKRHLIQRAIRLRKSPYADAYWFMYSSKLTYYTTRSLSL